MQQVRVVITKTEEWYLESFEVTCSAEHFTLVFWSGNRTNRMKAQRVQGTTEVTVTKEGWCKWFKNVVNQFWTSFKGFVIKVAKKVADMIKAAGPGIAIAGIVFKAIMWLGD